MEFPIVKNSVVKTETEQYPGIAIAEGDATEPQYMLVCPVCGFECTHVRCAYTALGHDKYEGGTAYPGTIARGVTPYRRDCLVITVDGECGHAWEIHIQQHKGTSYVWMEIVANELMEDELPPPAPPRTSR